MAGIMAAAAIVAIAGLRAGVQRDMEPAAEAGAAEEAVATDAPGRPPR